MALFNTLHRLITPAAALFAAGLLALPAHGAVVIQEVLYDGVGTDADEAFTELFGTPGMSLDGWSLVGINGSNGSSYRTIDLTGFAIPVDGLFVIGTASAGSSLAAALDMSANVDWQNGPDAVQLLSGSTVIDALQYGDAGAFNAGEGDFAADVSEGVSLSRNAFGLDTNNNSIDFSAGAPTPGVGPAVVPVPAAGWFMLSGLAGLGMFRGLRGPDTKKPVPGI